MDLLQVALREVMPSVELAKTGAYSWRGFNIRKFENLASGHFFCQIYLGNPSVILMEEFINLGGSRMIYPWRAGIDLDDTDFFDKDVAGQKSILVNFYKDAVRQALEWQVSDKRRSIVPEKILKGREFEKSAHLDFPDEIHRVTHEYITSLEVQDDLFFSLTGIKKNKENDEENEINEKNKIRGIINDLFKEAGLKKPYIQYNISGWNYRGCWIKLRTNESINEIPEGSFPYMFKIYYDHPELLRFQDDYQEKILDLAEIHFFNLNDKDKYSTLYDYIKPIVRHIQKVEQ